MNKELEIAILMADRCTRREAEKYLERGTEIYTKEDVQDYIDNLKACDCWEGETVESLMAGDHVDRQPIEVDGKAYLIVYVN